MTLLTGIRILELLRTGFYILAAKIGLKQEEPKCSVEEAMQAIRSLEQSFNPPLSSTSKKRLRGMELKDSGIECVV